MGETAISPRAARTRAALLAAGMDLLAARPIDAIAIDELVAAAGVAKGSFFNHFSDKQAFAAAVGAEVRRLIEARVAAINAGVADPVERLAGGMTASAMFAMTDPQRAKVMIRTAEGMTFEDNPLNAGVVRDVREAWASRRLSEEAERGGVLFWLGCCQALVAHIVDRDMKPDAVAGKLADMLVLGLRGLGVPDDVTARLSDAAALRARLTQASTNGVTAIAALSS